jgi:ElaB/YqjD/DUF883 family membrane-anchored ribosome-binding protein
MAKSISVTVTGNAAPLRKELKGATQDLSNFGKAQKSISSFAAIGYATAATSVFNFGKQVVQAALEDQKSQALLREAISKTTTATDAATASAESFVKELMFSSLTADDELRPALATLTRATGDVTRAQTLLALSTEIATATGKDLASVSMAVAKASLGSTTALGKLGVPLSDAAKESGNFALAFEELNKQFTGSNAAALDTAAGKIENLSLRFEELKESIGVILLPQVGKATDGLTELSKATDESASIGSRLGNIFSGAAKIFDVTDLTDEIAEFGLSLTKSGVRALGFGKDAEEAADGVAILNDNLGEFKDEEYVSVFSKFGEALKSARKRLEEIDEAQKKANDKFKALGDTLKGALNTALTDARNKLQAAKDEMNNFADATSSAISGNLSIGNALSGASDGENAYTEALKRRADAYRALNISKATGDIAGYTRALDEVAEAEGAVTSAQSARRSPGQLFADQIAKAKKFATDLKTLISPPFSLSEAGLSQLINLGIDSGSQVAAELVAGTGSLSVGAINEGLASVGAVAGQLGTSAGSIFRGGAVGAAQADVDRLGRASVTNNNNSYSITITSGVGDEVEIGKSVVKYLQAYDKKFSGIPIKVKK